jgi:hypothetical protein
MWSMTFAEFMAALKGYAERANDMRYMQAVQISYLLSPHMKKGKRPPSPEKILGMKQNARKALDARGFKSAEEFRKAREAMINGR